MKILVSTKRVPDTDQKIVVSPDGSKIETDQLPFVMNPFDAIALEEAVRISETSEDEVEVVAVGIGGPEYEEQLRTALAMGASRAVRIVCGQPPDPWNVARILHAVVLQENPDFVLMGKQAVDDDANQAGQFLAAILDWPQATFASKIELLDGEMRVCREVDQGLETIRLQLPAVITTDLRLNEPRYASLAGIMRARKKPIEVIEIGDLGVEIAPRVEVLSMQSVVSERQCLRVGNVEALIGALQKKKEKEIATD